MMTVEKLLVELDQISWKNTLAPDSLESICNLNLRGDSYSLAAIAGQLALQHQPITLRGLFYRVVSTGYFPSTDKKYYAKLGNLMSTLRREGFVPYSWIVDNVRSTHKPSSWSGLTDFTETVRTAYRKDFWSSLPDCVHVFIEKDAMTGVVSPVTQEYDVSMSPVRGYVSDSFAHAVGEQWRKIKKPIHVFYLGDFDPSGFDLERSLAEKLVEHSGRVFSTDSLPFCSGVFVNEKHIECESTDGDLHCTWERIALNEWDFDEHDLYELKPKKSDSRTKQFVNMFGDRCAEVDALPPTEIRQRVRAAIEQYIPQDEWERLKRVEEVEKESFTSVLQAMGDLQ